MDAQCSYHSPADDWHCPENAITGEGLCIFHDPNLSKDLDILKTRFHLRLTEESEDSLHFDGSVFPGGLSFEGVVFERSVRFPWAQFHGQVTNFSGTQFHGLHTAFNEARFHGDITNFSKTQFHGQLTSFSLAQFHGKITTFFKAKFVSEQWTHFAGAEFHSPVTNFVEAEFHSRVTNFRETRFCGDGTTFFSAKFRGQSTIFAETEFHSRVTGFVEAEFHGEETSFDGADFRGETIFKGPTEMVVSGRTITLEMRRDSGKAVGDTISFEMIKIGGQAVVVFDRIDLSRVRFGNTDLTRAKFLDVVWARPKGRWRLGLYDEVLWRQARTDTFTKEKFKQVDTQYLPYLGRLYRTLKGYYRQAGEHRLVGHFHYGLMEVEWHEKGHVRKWLSWEALYRIFSGYGEDYKLAGFWVLGIVDLFALAFWALGIPPEGHCRPWWEQLVHALLYSLQAGTLGRVEFYKTPDSLLARALHFTESVTIPIQFGFFAFALRNRFRR